jgi:ADP-ribose pyrophosphatase
MIRWRTISKEVVLDTSHIKIVKAEVELPNGRVSEYYHADSPGTVIVVPIKLGDAADNHTYIMVRQYRYPVGTYDLEFPAGRREPGESMLDAARRELKQETGYLASELKLIYNMCSNSGGSNGITAIYLAIIDDTSDPIQELDPEEELCGLKVEEITAKNLHKKILSMDITDSHTLAAIAAFVMNAKSATQYLGGSSEIE